MQIERAAAAQVGLVESIRTILETDRVWSAYALADLYPPQGDLAEWFLERDAAAMIYQGLSPAVLFAHGHPLRVRAALKRVPPGRYLYTLRGTDRAAIRHRLAIEHERHMWRMHLHPRDFPTELTGGADRLGQSDLDRMLDLMKNHPDRPDSFHPDQLKDGVYFGYSAGDAMVCMAGTHVVSHEASVAAVGNVFTHPDHRGTGLATQATASVVQTLLELGIRTVVLNVGTDNAAALAAYSKLGFWPYCGYYEGLGRLQAHAPDGSERNIDEDEIA